VVFILIEYDKNPKWYKNVLLTFGNHVGDSIQIVVGETKEEGCVILPCAIKLMEDGKKKVGVNELDLGFCLIHVFYIVLPCGFIELLGTYKVGQEENKSNKMTFMGVEHVITFPYFFTYYEQDTVKSIILYYYYNNVYQGCMRDW
jgi:hypothetical protein